jgi:MFS transporter, DHA3 family, macrolide efflux protein
MDSVPPALTPGAATTARPSLRVFGIVWLGQLVSLIGSGLAGFALGVWVYQRTGSVTDYAIICFFSTLPGILLAPIVGVIADRWSRRRAMMLADCGSGACMLILFLLLLTGRLTAWHIWIVMGVSASFRALQLAAYAASLTLLVPREYYTRANGAVQAAIALAQVCSPALGGILLSLIGIHAILLINVAGFLVAVASLATVRFPAVPNSGQDHSANLHPLQQATFGLRYIRSQPDLVALLTFFAGINFAFGISFALITPLILNSQSARMLGVLVSFGGVGMLAGGITMSLWSGPRRRVFGVIAGAFLLGAAMIVVGISVRPIMLGAAMLFGFFSIPIAAACFQSIWQERVPADLQGRVFAARNMLTDATVPLAFLLAGPLADHLPRIGWIFAGSPGFLLSATGAMLVLIAFIACFARHRDRPLQNS